MKICEARTAKPLWWPQSTNKTCGWGRNVGIDPFSSNTLLQQSGSMWSPWNASAGSELFKGYLGGGFVCRANLYLARQMVDITWKGLLKNRLMRRAIKGEWWREWKQFSICIALHQRVIALEWNSWTPSKGQSLDSINLLTVRIVRPVFSP